MSQIVPLYIYCSIQPAMQYNYCLDNFMLSEDTNGNFGGNNWNCTVIVNCVKWMEQSCICSAKFLALQFKIKPIVSMSTHNNVYTTWPWQLSICMHNYRYIIGNLLIYTVYGYYTCEKQKPSYFFTDLLFHPCNYVRIDVMLKIAHKMDYIVFQAYNTK